MIVIIYCLLFWFAFSIVAALWIALASRSNNFDHRPAASGISTMEKPNALSALPVGKQKEGTAGETANLFTTRRRILAKLEASGLRYSPAPTPPTPNLKPGRLGRCPGLLRWLSVSPSFERRA